MALLALCIALSSASCSGGELLTETRDQSALSLAETGGVPVITKQTQNPMTERPDYTLPAGASTDEIRAMVVKAMRDELSVCWVCPETYTFEKEKVGYSNTYTLRQNTIYAGIPYSNGGCGLLTWLEYYDPETGVMTADGKTITQELGNACTISVQWGWSSVLSNVTWHNNMHVVKKNNCLPVGPYQMDPTLRDLNTVSTHDICTENGKEVMYRSYAAALPADGVVTYKAYSNDNHMMMVIDNPHVVYNADGTINGEESYLVFQDQSPSYKLETRDGENVTSFGHLRREFSFEKLYSLFYIPFTHPELTGEKPYKGLQVTFLKNDGSAVTSFNDFGSAAIRASHPVIALTITVTDQAGKEIGSIRRVTTKERFTSNAALNYAATALPRASSFRSKLEKGASYTYSLSALMATGATVDLGEFDFIY